MVTTEELIKKYAPQGMSISGQSLDIDSLVDGAVEQSFSTPRPVEKTGLEKTQEVVGKVFAGEKIGEAIGTMVANSQQTPEAREAFGKFEGPSAGEVVGDIGRAILEVAGFKGAGIGKTVASTLARGTGLGAGLSATTQMAEGGDVEEVIKAGLIGGATGLATAGALEGAGALWNKFAEKMPSRFVQSAVRQSKAELDAGKDITPYVLKNKKIGTAEKLLRDSEKIRGVVDKKIDKILAKNEYRVLGSDAFNVNSGLFSVVRDNPLITNQKLTGTEVLQAVIKTAPSTKALLAKKVLTLHEVNQLRKIIDKSLGGKAFLTPKLANNKEITKAVANGLRNLVKEKAPATKKLFDTYSKEITLSEGLSRAQNLRAKNNIISFGDLVSMGVGSFGGLGGAIGTFAGRRALESTPAKLGGAVLVNELDKALSPLFNNIEPAVQTRLIEAIGGALREEFSPRQ
jgi:hypothetical protein